MELNFDLHLSKKDYSQFKFFQYNKILLALPFLLLHLVQFNIQKNPMLFYLKLSFFIFLLSLVFMLIYKIIQSNNTFKTYQPLLNTNQKITINNDGIFIISIISNIHISFDKVYKVWETKKYIYVYTVKNDVFIIPTYKIEDYEDVVTIRALIKNKLGNKKYKSL